MYTVKGQKAFYRIITTVYNALCNACFQGLSSKGNRKVMLSTLFCTQKKQNNLRIQRSSEYPPGFAKQQYYKSIPYSSLMLSSLFGNCNAIKIVEVQTLLFGLKKLLSGMMMLDSRQRPRQLLFKTRQTLLNACKH